MTVIRLFIVSFALFSVTDSVMLFANDGDTIKGMRKVKQGGRFASLTFRKEGFPKAHLSNDEYNFVY